MTDANTPMVLYLIVAAAIGTVQKVGSCCMKVSLRTQDHQGGGYFDLLWTLARVMNPGIKIWVHHDARHVS
jgi:hypothetical protein